MEKNEVKILITGSNGFIAQNLIIRLLQGGGHELMLCSRSTTEEELRHDAVSCDAVFHLAGVNRPENEQEFWEGNVAFTVKLLDFLKENKKQIRFIFASSIQAERDNPYGRSKLAAEQELLGYAKQGNIKLFIYRLPNVFGKWCRPNYNSVVATFCHCVSRGIDMQIHDAGARVELVYIDDVAEDMLRSLESEDADIYRQVQPVYPVCVGELAEYIRSFRLQRENFVLPETGDPFIKKLYSTYLSYLEQEDFKYPLVMHKDDRGSFTEFVRTGASGQVSVNVIKPGIVKGNHWHQTKVEKFLVVQGRACIRFRHMQTGVSATYVVSGERLEVVDIPAGYTHNIENIGTDDLVTVMWANETFDPNHPDTYYEEV